MPARDLYHDAFVRALEAETWKITDDPLIVSIGAREIYIDLGAEPTTIGAARGGS